MQKCFVIAEHFENAFNEPYCTVRSSLSFNWYAEMADNIQSPFKGFKQKSFLETKFLSAYRNLATDIQHDLFEGGVQYTLKLVLHQLNIIEKLFSCEMLP